jgi:mono/diheme cytochrome c family protein
MVRPYLPRTPRLLALASVLVAGLTLFIVLRLREGSSIVPVVILGTAVPPVPTLDAQRVDVGARVYTAACAGCHGALLEGAPNWRQPGPDGSLPPPPQDSTGHTWHHPDSLLYDIVADGGDPAHASRMPAFRGRLSADEIAAVLEYIKSTWGREEREFQWWITAREGQQEE